MNIQSVGLGRILALIALVITVILMVTGQLPILWLGGILLLVEAALLV